MVDALNGQFGISAGCPAIHAKGTWASGVFKSYDALPGLTAAPHLGEGECKVICRFSNGDGRADHPDGEAFSLGMAIGLKDDEGGALSDLLMVDAPTFITNDPEEFLDFATANAADEEGDISITKSGAYSLRHPRVTKAAIDKQRAPIAASYSTQQWWAVHAFLLVDGRHNQTPVRFSWIPVAGSKSLDREISKGLDPHYLQDDAKERLELGTIEFDLEVTFANDDDQLDDSRKAWPEDRKKVIAGRLVLDTWHEKYHPHRFIPNRYGEGIRPSIDPLIMARTWTYQESYQRRIANEE